MHQASPLFSLDEIIVEPRIQAPPLQVVPGQEFIEQDITSLTLPYLPDWPELPAAFQSKTLTLEQTLSSGANLILIGNPGTGKTVALAQLASQVARRDPSIGELGNFLPVLVHLSDLLPRGNFTGDPLEKIINAVSYQASKANFARLSELLQQAFSSRKVLFLLDGLDEAPPELHREGVNFLVKLLDQFSGIRLIVAASPNNISGLPELGLIPVALASWDEPTCQRFISLWGSRWQQFIVPSQEPGTKPIDQYLMDAWLGGSNSLLSPLELTLKVWSAYAGDAFGAGSQEAIQAYLNRITAEQPGARVGLETLALHLTFTQRISLPARIEQSAEVEKLSTVDSSLDTEPDANEISDYLKVDQELRKALGNQIPVLVEAGLLVWRCNNRLAFTQPIISGALAAAGYMRQPDDRLLLNQPEWTGKETLLSFLAARSEHSLLFNAQIKQEVDPRLHQTLQLARSLGVAPAGLPWRTNLLRTLASVLQNDSQPISLRGRALCALVKSGDPGISKLFNQMLCSSSESQWILAILGFGLSQERQSVPLLSNLLDDPSPAIGRAGCLALAAIGDKAALESLAWALINAEDTTRRSAAEALARFPVEGYSILVEGSQMENLLVRRAVIYGLMQVHQPGAIEILEKFSIEDKEWVVRAAATHALDLLKQPESCIPHGLPALSESAWLIAFAGEHGLGVSPGKPAEDLLRKALLEGTEEQKLAALDYLRLFGKEEDIPIILNIQQNFPGELREAAFNTLWHLGAAGYSFI
jgi:HEAT repeat protein